MEHETIKLRLVVNVPSETQDEENNEYEEEEMEWDRKLPHVVIVWHVVAVVVVPSHVFEEKVWVKEWELNVRVFIDQQMKFVERYRKVKSIVLFTKENIFHKCSYDFQIYSILILICLYIYLYITYTLFKEKKYFKIYYNSPICFFFFFFMFGLSENDGSLTQCMQYNQDIYVTFLNHFSGNPQDMYIERFKLNTFLWTLERVITRTPLWWYPNIQNRVIVCIKVVYLSYKQVLLLFTSQLYKLHVISNML